MHEDIKTKDARCAMRQTQENNNSTRHSILPQPIAYYFACSCKTLLKIRSEFSVSLCFVCSRLLLLPHLRIFSFSSVHSTSVFSSTLTFVLMCSFCLFTAPFYFLKFRCTSVLPLLSFGSSRIRLYSCTVM